MDYGIIILNYNFWNNNIILTGLHKNYSSAEGLNHWNKLSRNNKTWNLASGHTSNRKSRLNLYFIQTNFLIYGSFTNLVILKGECVDVDVSVNNGSNWK